MLSNYMLSDVVNFAIFSLMAIVAISFIAMSNHSTRYMLRGKDGSMSAVVFTGADIRDPANRFHLYSKYTLNAILGGLAAIAFAAIVTGTVRGNVGDLDKGGIAHALFVWFAFQQMKRVSVEHYILKTAKNKKPRTVKVDGNVHFVCEVDKLPWLIEHSVLTGFITLFLSALFVNFT